MHNSKSPDDDINHAIRVLERRDLDILPHVDVSSYTGYGGSPPRGGNQFEFARIKAISRMLPDKKSDVERFLMEDVVSGLHGLKSPFLYIIIGTRLMVNVYVGILNKSLITPSSSNNLNVLTSSLKSTFPDIEVDPLSRTDVESKIIRFFNNCRHYGVMTGIPTPKLGVEEYGVEQIERLIRGVYQEEFGYMVVAEPVQDIEVVESFDDIASIIRDQSALIKETTQYTKTSRLSTGGETLNRSVQHYVELLETLLDKLEIGKYQGMWRTMSYFFSPRSGTADKMSSLLKTVFSGDKSMPEAIRTVMLTGSNPAAILNKFRQIELELNFHPSFSAEHPLRKIIKHKLVTVLNSRDLSTLVHLPKEEMPGYDVKDTARFGVCLPEKPKIMEVLIGEIIDRGIGTGNHFGIAANDFVKHGLIAGVTGSGKTNTCLYLLHQLWSGPLKTPFLVIEPAKAEYRSLMNVNGYDGLLVFTLGDEMASPFRLNPFEIMDGVKLQTHIDNLRAVFNASFVMYAPMPYVLERCIYEIYQEKGWDLTTNRNRFSNSEKWDQYSQFPTLTDLYQKIDPVVEAMGYDDRLTMDIKAGLKARIASLRIGGKGAMLDTPMSLPMDLLLKNPTILELQSIGDDEEKAFIIGLLIARLYEFREAQNKQSSNHGALQHVTLVEEAHRILTKASTDFSNLENVNTKAKSVETFCNMLSEIRAFGEGILIAEQIPTKLAQDAIKNTNLKIMHRIVAKDDRDLLGQTMNLDERQNTFISIMDQGYAAAFSEGFSKPFLVKAPHFLSHVKTRNATKTTFNDRDVAAFMARRLIDFDHVYVKQTGCKPCQSKCIHRDASNFILSDSNSRNIFIGYLFGIVESKNNLSAQYPILKDSILEEIKGSFETKEDDNNFMFCFLINAGESVLKSKGVQHTLPGETIYSLINTYNDMIASFFTIPLKSQISIETDNFLNIFQKRYIDTFSISSGPFPGCNDFCKHKCLFRYDVEPLTKDKGIDDKLAEALNAGDRAKINVKKLCLDVSRSITLGNSTKFIENIALCFFIQKCLQRSVREILLNIKKWFM